MQRTNVLSYLEDNIDSCSEKLSFCSVERQMTFQEVYDESRSIGSFLCKKGYSGEPVVVFMPKRPETITAFFGVIYSGNFYVPIDSEMPDFRIRLILKNLSPRVIITDGENLSEVEKCEFTGDILLYDEISKNGEDSEALRKVREKQLDTDPIYVVFTSGSTGIPKGVIANHRSVIDYVENLSEELHFSSETIFGSQTPLYFDACLKELYPTLKFGACTWLIPKSLFSFPIKLVEFLNEHRINTICWVVSALTMISSMKTFDKVVPQYLTNIAFGSEVFPIKQFELWRNALPNASFTNLYGPTEATGMSCFFHVDKDRHFEADEPIPIGRPFKNTEILLLSEDGKLVKDGETGEICIRGTCLTLGYYNDYQRTDEVFVQNPLNNRYHELIYRTGDLGKLNEKGELIFISRKDYQIKHMGHRIELSEIEVIANEYDGIGMSAATYDKEKGKITLFYQGDAEVKDVILFLKAHLPRYMLPNRTVKLEKLPFTANGKIDRKTLMDM